MVIFHFCFITLSEFAHIFKMILRAGRRNLIVFVHLQCNPILKMFSRFYMSFHLKGYLIFFSRALEQNVLNCYLEFRTFLLIVLLTVLRKRKVFLCMNIAIYAQPRRPPTPRIPNAPIFFFFCLFRLASRL